MDRAYVTRLKLVNWRSFSDCVLDFDQSLNTFVGPNNAGKSTILEAINLAIVEIYHGRYVPPTTDFFMGTRGSFKIQLQISVPNNVGNEKSRWFYEKFFFQRDSSALGNSIGTLRIVGHPNKELEVSFLDGAGKWQEYSTYHLGKAIDFVYARSVRDISRHLATSFRSPFSEIRRILEKRLEPDIVKRTQERLRVAESLCLELDLFHKIVRS